MDSTKAPRSTRRTGAGSTGPPVWTWAARPEEIAQAILAEIVAAEAAAPGGFSDRRRSTTGPGWARRLARRAWRTCRRRSDRRWCTRCGTTPAAAPRIRASRPPGSPVLDLALDAVVADGGGRVQRLRDSARPRRTPGTAPRRRSTPRRRRSSPPGAPTEPPRSAVPADRRPPGRGCRRGSARGARHVRQHVRLSERSALRAEPSLQLLEEPEVDVHLPVRRAVEGTDVGRGEAAAGVRRVREEDRGRLLVTLDRAAPVGLDAVHGPDQAAGIARFRVLARPAPSCTSPCCWPPAATPSSDWSALRSIPRPRAASRAARRSGRSRRRRPRLPCHGRRASRPFRGGPRPGSGRASRPSGSPRNLVTRKPFPRKRLSDRRDSSQSTA